MVHLRVAAATAAAAAAAAARAADVGVAGVALLPPEVPLELLPVGPPCSPPLLDSLAGLELLLPAFTSDDEDEPCLWLVPLPFILLPLPPGAMLLVPCPLPDDRRLAADPRNVQDITKISHQNQLESQGKLIYIKPT